MSSNGSVPAPLQYNRRFAPIVVLAQLRRVKDNEWGFNAPPALLVDKANRNASTEAAAIAERLHLRNAVRFKRLYTSARRTLIKALMGTAHDTSMRSSTSALEDAKLADAARVMVAAGEVGALRSWLGHRQRQGQSMLSARAMEWVLKDAGGLSQATDTPQHIAEVALSAASLPIDRMYMNDDTDVAETAAAAADVSCAVRGLAHALHALHSPLAHTSIRAPVVSCLESMLVAAAGRRPCVKSMAQSTLLTGTIALMHEALVSAQFERVEELYSSLHARFPKLVWPGEAFNLRLTATCAQERGEDEEGGMVAAADAIRREQLAMCGEIWGEPSTAAAIRAYVWRLTSPSQPLARACDAAALLLPLARRERRAPPPALKLSAQTTGAASNDPLDAPTLVRVFDRLLAADEEVAMAAKDSGSGASCEDGDMHEESPQGRARGTDDIGRLVEMLMRPGVSDARRLDVLLARAAAQLAAGGGAERVRGGGDRLLPVEVLRILRSGDVSLLLKTPALRLLARRLPESRRAALYRLLRLRRAGSRQSVGLKYPSATL